MRYFHDVNSKIKKRLKALICYTVLKKILTFDTLNRGRTVFFNGGNVVPGSFIFVPGFRDKKYQSKTKRGQMARFLKKYLSKNNKLYILLIIP
jgi:hypothetical protein